MSVILIDMDMPNSCYECRLKNRCEYALANGWLGNKRDDKCPLKPYEERKKGKWVMHREDIVYTNGYLTKNEVVCSECGSRAFFDSETGLEKTPYCPYCGANMEWSGEE